jgi:hypothetical protein
LIDPKLKLNSFFVLLTVTLQIIGASLPQWADAGQCSNCGTEHAQLAVSCDHCKASHYCNPGCQKSAKKSHEEACLALRPYLDLAGGVEIRASGIPGAGSGLFATKEFKPGEPVAVYLGDVMSTRVENLIRFGTGRYMQDLQDPDLMLDGEKNPPAAHLGAQLANDSLVTTDEIQALLAVDCNDLSPAGLSFFKDFTQNYWRRHLEENRSIRLTEEFFGPDSSPAFVARIPIHPGDEIFYSYGAGYWLSHSVEACRRKGLPEKGFAILRHASMGLEEALAEAKAKGQASHVALYEDLIKDQGGLYTQEKHRLDFEHYSKNPLEFKMISLFAQAGLIGLFQLGNERDQESFTAIKAKIMAEFELEERLLEISKIPNSELRDEDSFAKIHPRTQELFRDLVDHLAHRGMRGLPWFGNSKTGEPIAWDDLLLILGVDLEEEGEEAAEPDLGAVGEIAHPMAVGSGPSLEGGAAAAAAHDDGEDAYGADDDGVDAEGAEAEPLRGSPPKKARTAEPART